MDTLSNLPKKSLFSKESEKILLGCSLSNTDVLNLVAAELNEADWFFPEHRHIFRVLKEFYSQDRPVDMQLVIESLKRKNILAEAGGVATIADLAHLSGLSSYVEEYLRIVKDKSILRKMVQAAQRAEKLAREEPEDVQQALDQAQQLFFQITQTTRSKDSIELGPFLQGKHHSFPTAFLDALEKRQGEFLSKGPNTSRVTGIPTGFVDLDNVINGLNPSHLLILAGRPGMGKTALGLNILENICFRQGKPVGIFSLEMPTEQLAHRIIASQSEVSLGKILQGDLTGVEFQKIVACVKNIENTKMIIDDQPNVNIIHLRSRARRMKEKYGIQLLMVDYLQLLDGARSGRGLDNRQSEIAEISRMMKNLARELHIPIVCLAQLSRKVEDRPGHRPMMSDLRESGCLAGNSLVKTIDGHCAIRNVAIGTTVASCIEPLTERLMGYVEVSHAFSSGKKETFSLTTVQGQSIQATANHKFLTPLGWKRLDQLCVGDFLASTEGKSEQIQWHSVAEIIPAGIQEVFDLTIPQWHNFVANGFIVHNSIEQDADIILFLLRREYYDPNDRPGLAEIIIAKNRYGATGQIELAYRSRLAQFANLLREVSHSPKEAPRSTNSFHDFSPS